MHKVETKYPNLSKGTTPGVFILKVFVFQVVNSIHFGVNETQEVSEEQAMEMRSIDFDHFLDLTKSDFMIIDCRYMGVNCLDQWDQVPTPFGLCLRLEIEENHHDDHLEHHHHQATNRGELFVVFSYMGSDAFGGRNQFFNGLTVFYDSEGEKYLDRTKSLTVSNTLTTPVLAFQHFHEERLGPGISYSLRSCSRKLFQRTQFRSAIFSLCEKCSKLAIRNVRALYGLFNGKLLT